jgi:leader peptidase (prepilin peptidase)/N-methyltransferase
LPPDAVAFHLFLAVVCGLLFGSFLNVCIFRLPRDLSVVTPRSFCPECSHPLAWYDNIPLLSFLLLRAHCRHCGKKIYSRYPLVEVAAAALLCWVVTRYGWSLAALKWALFELLLLALFFTDLEERILPDELTLGGAACGLLLAFFVSVPGVIGELWFPKQPLYWRSLVNACLGALFLAGPLWLLAVVYAHIRKKEGLGLGDVKLLVFMGLFLGLENGLLALMIGAVLGTVLGLLYIVVRRKDPGSYELPFGSFLCLGAALVPLFVKS